MQIYLTKNNINGMMYLGRDANDNSYYLGSGKYFKRALKKYGKHNFTKHIIQQLPERCIFDDLIRAEEYWLDKLNCADDDRFYNIINCGKGIKGYKHTTKAKLKIGQSAKRKYDDATKLRMKIASQGKGLGRKMPDDIKKKISIALKGKISIHKGMKWKFDTSINKRVWY